MSTPTPTPTPSSTPKEVNFKTIAVDFQTLANLHKQLNSFGLGDIDQLTYLTQQRLKEDNTTFNSPYYPLLYVVPSKVEHNPQYKLWEFNTTVSDIVEPGLQNNEDTLSDTLQILNDVVSQFRLSVIERFGDYIEKYYVDDEVVYTSYMGEQDDNLNGWNGVLKIKTMTSLDRCAAAFNTWVGSPVQHPDGINFKTFTDDFRMLSEYHKQIQSFGFGKLDEFTYWNEMRLKEDNEHYNSPYYPYLFVMPGEVTNKFGFMEYKFKLIVADIIQRDLENQIDVLSDTNQIMDDIIGQFRLSVTESLGNFNELYYLDDTVICTPFLEKYDDLLGGWTADLTIQVMSPLDRCDAAFNSWLTPTPTATPTQTPTGGGTTPTPTATETSTPTVTPTNTETSTPTVTPTNTETPTNTPTQTMTPTNTETSTSTPTPTNTETPTNTPTNTASVTPTNTETPTETPTQTPTETPTNTPTNTETSTPTVTPTNTETPTQTQTPTNTETPTNTPTNTETSTPTMTPTNTETPTNTPTNTETPTPSVTATQTETPTNTPTNTETSTPTQTPTNTETPTNTPTNTETPTPSVTATQTMTPTNTNTPTTTSSPTPTATQSFDADAATYLNAVLVAGGTGITSTVSAATNTMFVSLKSAGLYTKIEALYPFLGGTTNSTKWNAKNPVDTNAAYRITWGGGITYTQAKGVIGNGTSGVGNTNWVESGTTTGNTTLAFFISQTGTTGFELGRQYGGGWLFLQSSSGTNTRGGIDTSLLYTLTATTNAQAINFFGLTRTNNTQVSFVRAGGGVQTITQNTNAGTSPSSLGILAALGFGGYTNRGLGSAVIGVGMTTTELGNLRDIITTFNTTLGRNI